ncbi:hypothetical protein BHM03_00027018 [Ensete ventricosum]|nr:hypothetical protein BHM03_00027018 [Ensete ventricosum]
MALSPGTTTDSSWWAVALPAFLGADSVLCDTALLLISLFIAFVSLGLLSWALYPGGPAWCHGRACRGPIPIPGPRGFPSLVPSSLCWSPPPPRLSSFCPLFHAALFLPLLSVVIFQPQSSATIAALSLCHIIILPKGGLPPTTSIPPLLICCRPAFGSALPLSPLPPVGRRYPSPACYRSAPMPMPSLFLPCCRLLVAAASLALSRAFLPLHLHHHRCQLPDPALPNVFPVATAIAEHNRCPSPISSSTSSVAIAASPHRRHLSLVAAATHRCLLPCRCCPRCHSHFQLRPCRCTSLLPLLQLLATTAAPTISNQLFDILVILTSTILLQLSSTTSTMQTHAPYSTAKKRTKHH